MRGTGNFKFVLISFFASFFLFSIAFLLMMSYGARGGVKAAETILAVEEGYRPSGEDALAVLFMGSDTRDSSPGLYILAKFDPIGGALTILVLPPETAVQNNGRTESLAEVYKYGGAPYTRETLAKALGIGIDRFVRMDYASFVSAADVIGSAEAVLENDIAVETGGVRTDMHAGRQLLDGRMLLALMRAYKASPDLEDKYSFIGRLCVQVINQRIDIALSTSYSQIFEKIINLVDSDISYADFESRLEACAWMAKKPSPAALLTPSGKWDAGLYVLSDTFLARAAEVMG